MTKENVYRGYQNLKSAYENMPNDLDKKYSRAITKNYEIVEKIYEKLAAAEEKDEVTEYYVPDLELFR